ncbi:MAG TPA: D-cysteine desulfhydrase family protein [Vicinamibacterales bacterium]|nr:D-cysteine desulfhydrase family protein [Vicinamibacterales bacterium]
MFGALDSLPWVPLAPASTPIESLDRLRAALGGGPRLMVKRDDVIGFAFGGNKVRKLRFVAAAAMADGADTLITSGGIQSNHARVTAATAARLGLHCILVVNGSPPDRPTANALLDRLLGAELRFVASREERLPAMEAAAAALRRLGRHPYIIPVGASTPLGAVAFVAAVREMLAQIDPPDVIVHASSSGGTQAGLVAGCALAGLSTRVIGVSADEPAQSLASQVREIVSGLPDLLGLGRHCLAAPAIDIDDGFVGEGYGVPTPESRAAIELTARTEAIFLDPTYTAKAMAAMMTYVRRGDFTDSQTLLFWHTGGQVALFA